MGWEKAVAGDIAVVRSSFVEFLELFRGQGFTDPEIYQLVLIWLEPLAPEEE
jgi:hypothetical protein